MTEVVENSSEAVSWQGKLTPDSQARANARDDAAHGIKLRAAGRKLLGELVRPYRRPIIGVLLIVVAQVAATMAAPWLIGVAIDNSLPAALRGDYTSLTVVGSALLSGWLRAAFVLRSGAIGQRVLYDLRQRGYDHMQALSVAFHERFTSGR